MEFLVDTDLERFRRQLQGIDMDDVKREAARRIAEELAEMVRQAVVAEDDIISPALNSPYERGPGPSMASKAAWMVEPSGSDSYIVSPHPRVEQRAYVLNYGYPGRIYPKNAEALRFTIDGVPVFRPYVEGPDETGYWEAALNRLEKSGRIAEIAEEVLEDEVEESFNG